MFQSSKVSQKRLKTILKLKGDNRSECSLTPRQLKNIENFQILNLSEKIELILVARGIKLTTEIQTNSSRQNQKQIPQILGNLPFYYFKNTIEKPNKKTITWWQVSLNEKINYLMKHYGHTLSEIELGVLYGYPLSAIRAFAGLIEKSEKVPDHPVAYYLGGVFSKNYIDQEMAYFKKQWQILEKTSPSLAKTAKMKYEQLK